MSVDLTLIIMALAMVCVYAVVSNRLLAFGERFRSRAMVLGTQILRDGQTTKLVRREIEDDLATLPNWLPAWGVVLAVTPAALFFIFISKNTKKELEERFHSGVAPSLRGAYSEFHDAALFSWLSNSPAAATLTAIQFMFWSFIISSPLLANLIVVKVAERITRRHGPDEQVQAL